jgi:hypothetical protein
VTFQEKTLRETDADNNHGARRFKRMDIAAGRCNL